MSERSEKKEFNITVEPDYQKLNSMGIQGSNMQEIHDSIEKMLNPGSEKYLDSRQEYELFGRKFPVVNRIARAALAAAGNDSRYPFFDQDNIPALVKAGMEWYFKSKLHGQEITSDTLPIVEEYIKDLIDNEKKMPWIIYKDSYFKDQDRKNYDESSLLTIFAEVVLQDIIELEMYY